MGIFFFGLLPSTLVVDWLLGVECKIPSINEHSCSKPQAGKWHHQNSPCSDQERSQGLLRESVLHFVICMKSKIKLKLLKTEKKKIDD